MADRARKMSWCKSGYALKDVNRASYKKRGCYQCLSDPLNNGDIAVQEHHDGNSSLSEDQRLDARSQRSPGPAAGAPGDCLSNPVLLRQSKVSTGQTSRQNKKSMNAI